MELEMDLRSKSCRKNLSMNSSFTSFVDLPEVLVTDILTRLPVKTVVQSTSVCRLWYSIIKSPSFISDHYSRSTSDPSNYHILHVHTISPLIVVVTDDHHRLTRNPDIDFHFETTCFETRMVVGTCKGLVCLIDYWPKYRGHDIYLINPFIHKCKKLGVESSNYTDLITQTNGSTSNIQVGFGYSGNDYKVVRIINLYSSAKHSAKVEIYSLKSGTWKGIDASFENRPYGSSVFAHGCLYWCMEERITPLVYHPTGDLLCFDLTDEVFRQIKLPSIFFDHSRRGRPTVLAKNGSVAVTFSLYIDNSRNSMRFCLLVLEPGQDVWKELYYDNTHINDPMLYVRFDVMGFSVCGRLM